MGRSKSHGDLCHNAEGGGRERFGQSEETGRSVLEGHSQDMGLGRGALTRWGLEGYACSPVEHTDVDRGTLRNKKQAVAHFSFCKSFPDTKTNK